MHALCEHKILNIVKLHIVKNNNYDIIADDIYRTPLLGVVRGFGESTRADVSNSNVLSAGFDSCLCLLPGIFPHALSDQSKSSLGNAFKDTSSQQVKRMLSRDCILVWTRANSVVCKGTKTAKNSYNVFFCLWSRPKQINYRTFLV